MLDVQCPSGSLLILGGKGGISSINVTHNQLTAVNCLPILILPHDSCAHVHAVLRVYCIVRMVRVVFVVGNDCFTSV